MKLQEKYGFHYPKLIYTIISVYVLISLFFIGYFFTNFPFFQLEYLFPIILLLVLKYIPIVYDHQKNAFTLLSFAFPIVVVFGVIPIIATNIIGLIITRETKTPFIKRLFNSSQQLNSAVLVYFVYNSYFLNQYLAGILLLILSAILYSVINILSISLIIFLDKKHKYLTVNHLPSILEKIISNILNGIVAYYLYAEIGIYGILVSIIYSAFLSIGIQYQVAFSQQKKELHKTEQSAQAILDTIDYGVVTFDLNRNITSANPIALRFLQRLDPEPIGKKVEELDPQYSHEIYQFVLQTLQTKKGYQQKNVPTLVGNVHGYHDIYTYPMNSPTGEIQSVLLLYKNVTEEQFLKRQFVEADKLTRLGQIAASKVHEIKNPLTTVRGYLQFLRSKVMKGEEVKLTSFDVAIQEIDRTNELISSLLILSRQKNEQERILDLKKILLEIIHLFKYQMDLKNIELEYQLDEQLLMLGNENNLKQIFINIIINAIDAIDENINNSGKIKLIVKKVNHEVIIALSDNGVGIPKEDLQKLNLPFFSTKKEGTGLGLYVTYQLIEQHRGKITINSIMNTGTDVTICFPLYE